MASNTYDAVGNKYDVSEIITNIAPDDTPLYSRLGSTRATQVIHEWLEDDLGEGEKNAQPEGFTYFTRNAEPRARLRNYTQIMSRGMQVTETQQAVLHYGVQDEMAYRMAKALKEIAFDCEKALIEQDAQVLGSMSVAREFGGIPYWIVTNVLTNGSARALTFDLINNALEQTWKGGGKPNVLLISPRNKRVISTFTAGNTKYMEGNKTRKLSQVISVLETDFGVIQCMNDRLMPDDTIYGLSLDYMKKAFLRPFKSGIEIPAISDMRRKIIKGEWTLEMRAEKAHFKIEKLNGVIPAA